MKFYRFVLPLILLFFLLGCMHKKEDVRENRNTSYKSYVDSVLRVNKINYDTQQPKIIVFVTSVFCTSCIVSESYFLQYFLEKCYGKLNRNNFIFVYGNMRKSDLKYLNNKYLKNVERIDTLPYIINGAIGYSLNKKYGVAGLSMFIFDAGDSLLYKQQFDGSAINYNVIDEFCGKLNK